jgi:lactoylglutathione lyase
MSLKPLHHAIVTVTDLDRSIAFYEEALGFRTTMRAPVVGYEAYLRLPEGAVGEMAMMALGGSIDQGMIELLQWEVPGGVERSGPKRPGDPGVFALALEIEGETLAEIVARWRGQGIEPWSDVTPVDLEGYPTFHTILVEDPDGLLIELIQLPTREQVREFRAAGSNAAGA